MSIRIKADEKTESWKVTLEFGDGHVIVFYCKDMKSSRALEKALLETMAVKLEKL